MVNVRVAHSIESRTYPNRSRQFDIRIRYRTLPSPLMTYPVGQEGNKVQNRLTLLALLPQYFASSKIANIFLRKANEKVYKYDDNDIRRMAYTFSARSTLTFQIKL